MKEQRFVFYSFIMMAALLGPVATDAAPVLVSSKDYVDRRDNEVLINVAQTYATVKDAEEMKSTVNYVAGQVNELKDSVSGMQPSLGYVPENTANKTDTVNAQSTTTQYPSAAAVHTAIEQLRNDIPDGTDLTEIRDNIGALTTGLMNKQDTLTEPQQAAVDSGITAEKVAEYDTFNSAIDNKVSANAAIEPGTGTKITYDAKGLVTGSASLTAEDIPQISTDKVSGLANVAVSGSYADLTDAPTIPTVDATLSTDSENAIQNKAVATALNDKASVSDVNALTTRVDTNANAIGTLGDLATTEQTSLVGAINEVKSKTDDMPDAETIADITSDVSQLKTDLSAKADVATTYTKTETDSKIVDLAIPQPDADCMAASGLCVLSVTTDGDLAWINVTVPAQ